MNGKFLISVGKALAVVVILNLIGSFFYVRFDLTEDKRFTLSKPAIAVAQKFDSPVVIDVLLDGNIPAEFSRLKAETIQLLESYA
ncbi:MAG: Gldg family protein, partial [Allomuricauda sp.]